LSFGDSTIFLGDGQNYVHYDPSTARDLVDPRSVELKTLLAFVV
jgi:hypothetical protein